MAEIIIGKQNTIAYTWTVVASVGTLVVSGLDTWDLGLTDIVRVFNITHTGEFKLDPTTTFSNTFVAGLKTYTWTFSQLPAGTVSGDTLLIYLNVTEQQALILLMQYQKA
jgi:hypothetical protein